MALSKTLALTAVAWKSVRYHLADAASPHPGALVAEGSFTNSAGGEEFAALYLETADRDGLGVLLGTYTPIAGVTAAQIANLRTYLSGTMNLLAKANGYV